MAIQKTEAIVLKNQDIRETSLLVTFFTKDFGKIQGIAKGIRGQRGRINNGFEPLALCNIVFYERKRGNLHTISQCDLKNYFTVLRKDLKKTAYGYYFIELVKDFLQLHDKNESIFNLLFNSLDCLNGGRMNTEILARSFELKLLSLSGFKPKIDSCLKCCEPVKEKAFFCFKEGGLVCEKCLSEIKNAATGITHEAMFFIHLLESRKLSELLYLKLTNSVQKELAVILHQFMQVHIEKKFKSLDFVKHIEDMDFSREGIESFGRKQDIIARR